VETNLLAVIVLTRFDRNFLLFIPTLTPSLRSILSYYTTNVSVGPELDAGVQDENIKGLGIIPSPTSQSSLLPGEASYINAARATRPSPPTTRSLPLPSWLQPRPGRVPVVASEPSEFPWDPGESSDRSQYQSSKRPQAIHGTLGFMAEEIGDGDDAFVLAQAEQSIRAANIKAHWLTSMLPDPGYFVAGGVAGAISRTATAPLDRLKVYLIAQTSMTEETVQAVKSGEVVQALKTASMPLKEACVDLWKMGGIKSLFAGTSSLKRR